MLKVCDRRCPNKIHRLKENKESEVVTTDTTHVHYRKP